MANPDIYIKPGDGTIGFSGANTGTIQIRVAESGDVHFEGDQGSLLSITDDLSDSLFSANDAAGMPVFEVFADDTIKSYHNNLTRLEIDPSNSRIRLRDNTFISGNLTVSGDITSASASHEATSYTASTHVSGISGYFGKVGIGTTQMGADARLVVENGKVGIGTTNPYYTLEVRGGDIWLDQGEDIRFGGSSHRIRRVDGDEFRIQASTTDDYITFYAGADLERMRIETDGKVAIGGEGNTAAGALLTVSGDASITGETRIAGSVGIGTKPESYKLTVLDTITLDSANSTSDTVLRFEAAKATKWRIKNDTAGAGTDHTLTFTSAGAANVAINQAGNVGIGTADPVTKLHVNGALMVSGTSNSTGIKVVGDDDYDITIVGNDEKHPTQALAGGRIIGPHSRRLYFELLGNEATDHFRFLTSPNNDRAADYVALHIGNNGNVGIGTNNPDGSMLRVNGDVGVSGELRVGGGPLGVVIGSSASTPSDTSRTLMMYRQNADYYPGGDTHFAAYVKQNTFGTYEGVHFRSRGYRFERHDGSHFASINRDGEMLIGEGIGQAGSMLTVSGDASITGELRANGNLGIGAASPVDSQIKVYASENTVFDASQASHQRSEGATLNIYNGSDTVGSFAQVLLRNRASSVGGVRMASLANGTDNSVFRLSVGDTTEAFSINGAGQALFGAGQNQAGALLTVSGNASITGELAIAGHTKIHYTNPAFDLGQGGATKSFRIELDGGDDTYMTTYGAGNRFFFRPNSTLMLTLTDSSATIASDLMVGNSVVNIATNQSTQKGLGFDASEGELEVAAGSSQGPLVLGRTVAGGMGTMIDLRQASNTFGTIKGKSTGGGYGDLEIDATGQLIVNSHLSLGASAGAQTYDLYCDDAYMAAGFVSQYIYHKDDTDTNINFTTDKIQFNAGNGVGIGTSSFDGSLLGVGGDVGISGALRLKGNGNTTAHTFDTQDSAGNQTFYIQDGGRVGVRYYPFVVGATTSTSVTAACRMQVFGSSVTTTISNSGFLGIDKVDPIAKLHVGAPTRNAGAAVQTQAGYFAGAKSAFHSSSYLGLWQNQLHIADTSACAAGIGGAITFGATQNNSDGTFLASIEAYRDNGETSEYGGGMVFRTRTNGSATMGAHMFISSVGQVGIGTTGCDGSKLRVNGDVGISGELRVDDGVFVVDATDDQVGIGTKSPASLLEIYESDSSEGNTQLHIHNDKTDDAAVIKLEGKRTSINDCGQVLFANHGNNVAVIKGMAGAGGDNDDGAISFSISAPGTADNVTEAMRITNTGNVGIGTDNPQYKLEVASSTIGFSYNGAAGAGTQTIKFEPSSAPKGGVSKIYSSYAGGAATEGRLALGTYGETTTLVMASGRVGIGTAIPQATLQVNGEASITGGVTAVGQIRTAGGALATPSFGFTDDAGLGMSRPTTQALNFITSSTEQLRIDSAGTIRVKNQTVVVGGNSRADIILPDGSGIVIGSAYTFANIYGEGGDLHLRANSYVANIGEESSIYLSTATAAGGQAAHVVVSGGKVGIGTVSPGSKLEVAGSGQMTNFAVKCTSSYRAANLAEVNNASLAFRISQTRQGQTSALAMGSIGSNNADVGIQAYDSSDNSHEPLGINPFGGYVGIGTATPSTQLHILGNNGDQLSLDNDGDQWTQINFANNGTNKTFVALDHTNHNFIIGAQGGYSSLNKISFRPDGSNDDVVIHRNGTVGFLNNIFNSGNLKQSAGANIVFFDNSDYTTKACILVGSNNQDIDLIRVRSVSANNEPDMNAYYGGSLRYMGARSDELNSLSFFMHQDSVQEDLEVFSISQRGKVLIGPMNTAPSAMFTVSGDAQITGNLNTNSRVYHKDGNAMMAFYEFNNGATLWLDGANGDLAGGDYFGISATNDGALTLDYNTVARTRMESNGDFKITGDLRVDSYLIYADSTENQVGIGTSVPHAKLQVNGDASVTGDLRVAGNIGVNGVAMTNYPLHIYTDSSSDQTIFLDNDGDGQAGITLRTDRNSDGNATNFIYFDGNDSGGNNTRYSKIESFIVDNSNTTEDGRLTFSAIVANTDTQLMHVANKGVGIGTDWPQAFLDVSGSSTTWAAEIRQGNHANGDGLAVNIDSDAAADYCASFRVKDVNTFDIKGDRRVGIREATPEATLQVGGDASITGDLSIGSTKTIKHGGDADTYIQFGSDYFAFIAGASNLFSIDEDNSEVVVNEAGGNFNFRVESDNEDHSLYVRGADGHVGIGTSAPSELLTLQSAVAGADDIFLIKADDAGNCFRIGKDSNDNSYLEMFDGASTPIITRLNTAGDSYFNGGDVGIGTTAPTGRLHVEVDSTGIIVANTEITGNAFEVFGEQGNLLTITDDLSDSLFSVNDAAGMPVFETFADDTIKSYHNNLTRFEVDPANERIRLRDNVNISGDTTVSGELNITQYVKHVGDTNTLFGFPSNDNFVVRTNGDHRLQVDSYATQVTGELRVACNDGAGRGALISDGTYGNDYVAFSHAAMTAAGEYALLQSIDGHTFLNANNGYTVYLRINNGSSLAHELTAGTSEFNANNLNNDFIVQGDSSDNMFVIDAGEETVGIGAAASSAQQLMLKTHNSTTLPFIDFANSDGSQSSSKNVHHTTSTSTHSHQGWIKIKVNGTDRYLAFYS